MKQKNANQTKTNDAASKYKIDDKENWLNEHGHPSNKFLQRLADDASPAALEKLKSIATDLDAKFSPEDTAQELIGAIRMATRSNSNTTA